jgi:DNA-binding NarL/FixJ family response regulator
MASFSVLILHVDVFSAESLRRYVLALYPGATCTLAASAEDAEGVLKGSTIDLFIATADLIDDDVLDLLLLCRHRGYAPRRTLVTVKCPSARVLISLRAMEVNGIFDAGRESSARMAYALEVIGEGRGYQSPGLWERVTQQNWRLVSHQLAPSEQLALAIIGDGCGDDVASTRLNMTASSIRALRRDLHAKLDVHDRHEMICRAAQLGFTSFTPNGVAALGLSIVVLEYITRSKRPIALAPELLARCRIGAGGIIPPPKSIRRVPYLYPLK